MTTSNYAELFLPTYENNVEVIFDRQYMENAKDKSLGSDIDQFFAPQMMGDGRLFHQQRIWLIITNV